MKHTGPISGVATRGTYIATAGYDNRVILWDGETKRAIACAMHDHLANQCDFSSDGKYLVSSSSDYTARIWELPTMRLKAVLSGHPDDVDMAVFSPSARFVATCSRGDYSIRVFDLEGKELKKLRGHTDYVTSLAWNEEETEIISSGDDGTVRRWDVREGRQLQLIDVDGVQTETAVISRSGVVYAGDDLGRIAIAENGSVRFVQAHEAGIKRVVLDASQRLLATSSYDGFVIVWEIDERGVVTEKARTAFPSIVWPRSASFWSDAKLVFGTFGSCYAVYDFAADAWQVDHIEPDASVNAVCTVGRAKYTIGDAGIVYKDGAATTELGSLCNFLLPFGGTILTGGQLGCVYDALSGALLYKHRSPLNCGTAYTVDGIAYAAIGSYTGEALIFQSDASGIRFIRSVALHQNAIKSLAASDGKLFSACATAAVAWHDLRTYTAIETRERAHTQIANGCTAVRGGFASIGRDRMLRIWSRSGARSYETPHQNSIKCISSDQAGRYLASGSYAGMVAIFDLFAERWVEISRPTMAGISSICFDAEQQCFIASSYDGALHVYPLGRYKVISVKSAELLAV